MKQCSTLIWRVSYLSNKLTSLGGGSVRNSLLRLNRMILLLSLSGRQALDYFKDIQLACILQFLANASKNTFQQTSIDRCGNIKTVQV